MLQRRRHNVIFDQGYDAAKKAVLEFLEGYKKPYKKDDKETLTCVARTSLRTKLNEALADQLTDIVTDAVLTVLKPDAPLDLHMVRLALPGATSTFYAD